jgi:hypothetical protein
MAGRAGKEQALDRRVVARPADQDLAVRHQELTAVAGTAEIVDVVRRHVDRGLRPKGQDVVRGQATHAGTDTRDEFLGELVLHRRPRPPVGAFPGRDGEDLEGAAAVRRARRVDDRLVDHEQPWVAGVRLAAAERLQLRGDAVGTAQAGRNRPHGPALVGE